ncbi:hypothetical protein BRC68_04865 [Halobacteriales archaeon QH_6_64_20]|nr:MAG: hypothetical protein BRC68_04865 [Halobacteriales archaeon QH_6_64_20]
MSFVPASAILLVRSPTPHGASGVKPMETTRSTVETTLLPTTGRRSGRSRSPADERQGCYVRATAHR